MLNSLRAIIFDLDGVIVNSEPLHDEANRRALAYYGIELPDSLIEAFIGKPDLAIMEEASLRYLNSLDAVPALMELRQQFFRELAVELQPIPGVLEFLRRARPVFQAFGLATSSLRENQEITFDQLGLHPWFSAVVTVEDVEQPKPDPEPYRRAAVGLGLTPAECLVIEDSVKGIASAKGAGCVVIGLTTSFPSTDLAAAGADYVCTSFGEIAHLLEFADS